MYQRISIFSSLLLLLSMASCAVEEPLMDHSRIAINDATPVSKRSQLSDYYDLKEVIMLRSEDARSMIGNPDKILAHQGNYYILDRFIAGRVFAFDGAGNHLYNFGEVSEAPGGYVSCFRPRDTCITISW